MGEKSFHSQQLFWTLKMARIQRLSPNLINKIAAGEVIERPGSVVKELMENSIDAGSTRIDVVIEKGGSELIRISDNGCGMDAEDLILAVTSHATSKLRTENDLFTVRTMGFRGEAMASIAEISQMTVRSRVNPGVKPKVGEAAPRESGSEISGMELRVEGGEYQEPTPCGCPVGTQIDVRNLFFNTPVRRKFLKSTQTEFGYISEFFTRLALANPQIHFTLRHNSRIIYDLPATENWLQRICDAEGKELADALIHVEYENRGVRVSGYAARPNHSRSSAKMQFLFLNGRPIRDRALQHALLEAYRGLLTQNRFPICFLKLDMPPEMVDVNVHPTKMEVRFQNSNEIYGQLLSALRSKFLQTNMATFVGSSRPANDPLPALTETFRNLDAPNPGHSPSDAESSPSARAAKLPWLADAENDSVSNLTNSPDFSEKPDWETARSEFQNSPETFSSDRAALGENFSPSGKSAGGSFEPIPPFKPFEDLTPGMTLGNARLGSSTTSGSASGLTPKETLSAARSFGVRSSRPALGTALNETFPTQNPTTRNRGAQTSGFDFSGSSVSASPTPSNVSGQENRQFEKNTPLEKPLISRNVIQIHQRYIVSQCEEGLMVVDQHAMHERILYERLKNRMKSMSVEVERLVIPEPIDLRPAEAAMLLERREQLESMGIYLESFGGNTVLVHALPAMLFTFEKKDRLRADELLHEILEVIRSGGGELSLEKFMDDTLHTIACKAACKAGQALSAEEMRKLLDEYQTCPAADHCPHGRPAVLIWSCAELDKLFCRIL